MDMKAVSEQSRLTTEYIDVIKLSKLKEVPRLSLLAPKVTGVHSSVAKNGSASLTQCFVDKMGST
jgi:hypothetical protein